MTKKNFVIAFRRTDVSRIKIKWSILQEIYVGSCPQSPCPLELQSFSFKPIVCPFILQSFDGRSHVSFCSHTLFPVFILMSCKPFLLIFQTFSDLFISKWYLLELLTPLFFSTSCSYFLKLDITAAISGYMTHKWEVNALQHHLDLGMEYCQPPALAFSSLNSNSTTIHD